MRKLMRRSAALAALVITLMHSDAADQWGVALTRVGAVVTGSLIALAVTWLFHSLLKFSYGEEVESSTVKSAGG